MLRQPQLHSSITRAHVHVCAPHYLQSPTQHTHTHTLTYTLTHIHNPAVAMGDRGVSARVWHALSQVAQENDDSWQLAVWHPPKNSAPSPLPLAIRLVLPPSLSLSPLFTFSHLSLYPSPSFSPSPMHADCGPIIAPAPVWIALHLWKSPCGLLVFLYMFLFGAFIVTNWVFCFYFYSSFFDSIFLNTS